MAINTEIEEVEFHLLLEGIAEVYGYDFRRYKRPLLLRRLRNFMAKEGFSSVSALQDRVFRDSAFPVKFVESLSVHTTSMFRDAHFFRTLRTEVVPMLRTYPFIRIWVAGCSTGEEAYSVGIVMEEEGLYDRCRIYATDISDSALSRARKGIFRLPQMRAYTQAYLASGGRRDFSSYYSADSDHAVLRASLRRNVLFAQHNLVCDRGFNEFQLIICRNVMIYFQPRLRAHVHKLLFESLCNFGILGLGDRESISFTPYEMNFKEIVAGGNLYRKVRRPIAPLGLGWSDGSKFRHPGSTVTDA